ncbi:hypothetical protein [Noviherbaspirillum sp. ST9]|uniref:hypothetical protein n=1 Tax=Noviherbaspirillum sp. ST9 TaxID=3401606 RepID=UPI003B588482
MLADHPFPSGAFALAVLAAFAAPAHGEDLPGAAEAGDIAVSFESESGHSTSVLGLLPPQDALLANPYLSLESMLAPSPGVVEVSRSFGNAALSVSVLPIRESPAYAGSWPSSTALQVSGAYQISPKMAIAGQAAYGITPGARSSDSLANDIARARTNTFSFALVAADRVRRGDRLSVSLSQPMRSYSGRFAVDMLPRSGGNGASRERLVFSMVPVGREMRAQLNYQMPAGAGATFGMTLMVRRNSNNLADASAETLVVARYVKPF